MAEITAPLITPLIKANLEETVKYISYINPLFFPANEYWYWKPIKEENISIKPKETYELWNERGSGWIFFALFWADNPKLTLQIDVYADSRNDIVIDFETLDTIGSLALGQGYFTLSKYDPDNNVYVAQYAPIGFGVPFRGKNRGVLYNPTTTTINVKLATAWLIMIKTGERLR